MKRTLFIIFVIMTIGFHSIAQETKNSSSSFPIGLKIQNRSGMNPKTHRAPMQINIEVYYNTDENAVEISYDGDAEGEVFLYQNENVVGYSSELNATLPIPSEVGMYMIEIVCEQWTAQGFLEL